MKNKHICGLECEHYCCEIEGHEFDDFGMCIHCDYEDCSEDVELDEADKFNDEKRDFRS